MNRSNRFTRISDRFWGLLTMVFIFGICILGAGMIPGIIMVLGSIFNVVGNWLLEVSEWYRHLNMPIYVSLTGLIGIFFFTRLMRDELPFKKN